MEEDFVLIKVFCFCAWKIYNSKV